jgi:hypothetical protein
MIALAKVMSRAFPASSAEAEILKIIAIFCGLGLLASLSLVAIGFDLSPGLF